jgi:flavin reductase (DIM6/NTAB) family NADH-FMN oxidoreductase RutF
LGLVDGPVACSAAPSVHLGEPLLFYEPHLRDTSLLPHDPFKAAIAPRPIGWVSTVSAEGAVNLAPYSFFNAVSGAPPMIAFSSEGMKDSASFAAQTREFVWNMPTWDLREAMNATSASLPRGDNEFAHAGLEMAPSRLVTPPRVAASPCALECKVTDTVTLIDLDGRRTDRHLVIGQVVGVHLDERYIADGILDVAAIRPIARCGYAADYTVLDSLFQMQRPR